MAGLIETWAAGRALNLGVNAVKGLADALIRERDSLGRLLVLLHAEFGQECDLGHDVFRSWRTHEDLVAVLEDALAGRLRGSPADIRLVVDAIQPRLVRTASPDQRRLAEQIAAGAFAAVALAVEGGGEATRLLREHIDGSTAELRSLLDERLPKHIDDRSRRASAPALVSSSGLGRLDGVPPAPLAFVEPDELGELRSALLAGRDNAIAITGGGGLGLYGQGGIGKTVLAAALARDDQVRRHFPDGVYWVSLGERPGLLGAQLDLLARLGVSAGELRTTLDAMKALERALAGRRCLLVVDDVWTAAAAQAFDVAGTAGRVVYTTRDPATLRDVGADVRRIWALSEDAARQLLAGLTNTPVGELPGDVDRVLTATGRVALALALIGAAVGRGGRDWRRVADALEQAEMHPDSDVFKAMKVAVARLDPRLADAHEKLAVSPEDARVPVATVARLWAHTHGASPEQTRDWVQQLAARELITIEGDRIVLHDLQRDFLLLRVRSLRLLHHELLQAYRALLPPPRSLWRTLPQDEPYIREHLIWHLIGAGDTRTATTTATDLGYLAIRAFHDGPRAAERDVHSVAAIAPQDDTIAWLLEMLGQWGHLLAGHDRLADLAATLRTRVTRSPPGVDTGALSALLPPRALIPCWGLPTAHPALRRVLEGHSNSVTGVAFSPDGTTLASASDDASVRLWDVASATQTTVLESFWPVKGVAFSPDGTTLASATDNMSVWLWDVASAQSAPLGGHVNGVEAVAFSPDGETLASASRDESVRLWDVASATQAAVLKGHIGWVDAVAFSPDGATLASASSVGPVRLWDVASATQTAQLEGDNTPVAAVAFSPDGATLACASDRSVWLWDVASATQTAQLQGHMGCVRGVAFSPDGTTLATASSDGSVRLWDVASATQTAQLQGHNNWVTAVAFSPDGETLASASSDGSVQLWEVASATQTTVLEGHTDVVNAVAFSPDGATLASASDDRSVRLWDVASATQTAQLQGHNNWVTAVAFSPDGETLASASSDGSVQLWEVASATQTAQLQGHNGAVEGVAFSPDGTTLASAGHDRWVRLWDVASATQTTLLEVPENWVIGVAFSPDGATLTSAGSDGSVQLWDVASATRTTLLKGHKNVISAAAFSPDGETLASASSDGSVRLWDAARATQTAQFQGHNGAVAGVAFSPDGETLASASRDGSVRLWNVAGAPWLVSVRLGSPATAVAQSDRGLAVGLDSAVAYFRIVDGSGS